MLNKIGIIGFGNIAKAIISPLIESDFVNSNQVYCLVKSQKSFDEIRNSYPHKINVFLSNSIDSKLVWEAPIKLLSIKPQQLNNLSIVPANENKSSTIISILAGVSLKKLEKKFPNDNCVRVVTNIPILIGKGLTGIAWGSKIDDDRKQFIKKIFENSSKIYEMTEDYLDIFLSLTSSSPAIIALIIDSLSDGGLSGGLNKQLSEELVIDMIFGTVSMMKDLDVSPSELKNMVTSPAGTTIAALRILEKKGLRSALIESIMGAMNKSKEFK